MPAEWEVSQGFRSDFAALGELMYLAVHDGDSPYTQAQRRAWISAPRSGVEWEIRLGAQYVLIGKDGDKNTQGFMSLRPDGYVDFAYILHNARGLGLFRRLYLSLEARAQKQGIKNLSTHASLMAMPAFARVGFMNPVPESVKAHGQSLKRFAMSKVLE
jgi:putative acetyltransferase